MFALALGLGCMTVCEGLEVAEQVSTGWGVVMKREYDRRTGRPLVGGRDRVEALTVEELEAEVTIAAAEPRRGERRLNALLSELARRRPERVVPSG
jgi:hypothetical protein